MISTPETIELNSKETPNEHWDEMRHFFVDRIIDSYKNENSTDFGYYTRLYKAAYRITHEVVDFGGLDNCLLEANDPMMAMRRPAIYRSQFEERNGVKKRKGPELRDAYLEAPRFYIVKGSEMGYHCHVYETRHQSDTGLMLTVMGNETLRVYGERHRTGKVKRPVNIQAIGRVECEWLANTAVDELSSIPEESRRQPSKNAFLLGTFQGFQYKPSTQ